MVNTSPGYGITIRVDDAIVAFIIDEQLNANFIVPSVFDVNVAQKLATAVKGL